MYISDAEVNLCKDKYVNNSPKRWIAKNCINTESYLNMIEKEF